MSSSDLPKAQARTLSRDTTPEAEAVQIEIYRRMTPKQKLAIIEELNRQARELVVEGLRLRHPDAGPEEQFRRLMDLTLGEELAERVFGSLEEAVERDRAGLGDPRRLAYPRLF